MWEGQVDVLRRVVSVCVNIHMSVYCVWAGVWEYVGHAIRNRNNPRARDHEVGEQETGYLSQHEAVSMVVVVVVVGMSNALDDKRYHSKITLAPSRIGAADPSVFGLPSHLVLSVCASTCHAMLVLLTTTLASRFCASAAAYLINHFARDRR